MNVLFIILYSNCLIPDIVTKMVTSMVKIEKKKKMTNLHSDPFTDMMLVKQYDVIENSETTMYTYLRFGYIAEISYEKIEEK